MSVLKCNSKLDAATMEAIEHAAEEIRSGNLVVYPTDTVYGIGANPFDQVAVKKLFLAKNRPFDMPLTLAVADKDMVEQIAIMTKPVEKLIDAFLPGPLTIITNKNPNVPDMVTSMSFKVGIRIPEDPVALELIKRTGPIIATSANLHSQPDATSVEDAQAAFGDKVSTYLDKGISGTGRPSTIVWISDNKIEIIRQGDITKKQIEDALYA
ncbi:MAG: threonylcarbamoyl-AMP synthase [Candidatus Methanomethylophilaceae archaeon]|nr:threonylcarbamoyl-AMP synthase [Candidatus Methanomethylophilaceae archaeon]MBO7204807.1 threonylcarbamoyl-AMP synthase [Candidatus Methanomethylophilaceae archaeon]